MTSDTRFINMRLQLDTEKKQGVRQTTSDVKFGILVDNHHCYYCCTQNLFYFPRFLTYTTSDRLIQSSKEEHLIKHL